ncbi:hypothetical protein [Sporosarcina cyprini]|uniref:hypothetical protein n=1 Tax=Sporosarcina cyprini TaxID=2910523 RepID=UPI001EE023A4|nr:hypothetical protein [Sporosarcina cyprini]MCG3088724.1 hypothetical protein [Sporosarcina cyprini]
MPLDVTTFILTIIFAFVLFSFVLVWVVRSAIHSSGLMEKIEKLEEDLADLKKSQRD